MDTAEEHEARYTPSLGDFLTGNWLAIRGRPALLTAALLFFVALPWACVLLDLALDHREHIVGMALEPFLVVGAFAGISVLSYTRQRRGPAFGEIRHRVTAEGLVSSGRAWSQTVQWSAISRCVAWRGTILLYSGARPLFFIPSRAASPRLLRSLEERIASRDAARRPNTETPR